VIRRAGPGDAGEIAQVINAANYRAYRGIIPEEFFKYPVITRDKVLEEMGRMEFYVYEVNGRILGVAALEPRRGEGVGFVWHVYVRPECQRRGVGTALMKRVEGRARELGLRRLQLITHERAYWAIRFYERLGFRVINHVERAAWRDVLMEKTIVRK